MNYIGRAPLDEAAAAAAASEKYWFDAAAADLACAYFEHCLVHTKGHFARRSFILEPWQRDNIIRPLFGWKNRDADNPAECTRRYRRLRLWVPRKNGKSQLSAGIGAYMMTCDAEDEAQVYSVAANEDQASLTWKAGLGMIQASPVLRDLFRAKTSEFLIIHEGFRSHWEVLTGRVKGKHGLNCSCLLGDELHEWPSGELYDVVVKSMAMRRQPLIVDTSTAGVIGTWGHRAYELDRKIADGVIDEPETLVVIYEADADDDWQDPAVWAKANPNLGVSVRREFLQSECRKAVANPSLENWFRNYHLNQWTGQAVRWIPMHLWQKCQDAADGWRGMFEAMRGRACFVGVDMSSTNDLTAVIYVFPPAGADMKTRVACRFYMPADNIERRVKDDNVPYDGWAAEGAIVVTEGNAVDQVRIRDDICGNSEQPGDAAAFAVKRVGLDKWNTGYISPQLVAHFGVDEQGKSRVVTVQQGYGSMSPGAKELERLVLAGMLDHGGHPVLRWMASNVAIKRGQQGDIVPLKDKSAEKIDGIVATIIAMSCMVLEPVEVTGDYFVVV